MSKVFERSVSVEMLLNSLEAERYVRRALLENVIDQLNAMGSTSVTEAQRLLAKLEAGANDAEFRSGLKSLRRAVADSSAPQAIAAA